VMTIRRTRVAIANERPRFLKRTGNFPWRAWKGVPDMTVKGVGRTFILLLQFLWIRYLSLTDSGPGLISATESGLSPFTSGSPPGT